MANFRLRFVFLFLVGFASLGLMAQDSGLSLDLKAPESGPWAFAQSSKAELVIKNTGAQPVLVTRVRSSSFVLPLTGPAYGSLAPMEDGLALNTMSQQATQVDLHRGLLLPGQGLTLSVRFTPLAREERFRVEFYREPPLSQFLMQTSAHQPTIEYGPFNEEAFRAALGELRTPSLGPGTDAGTVVGKSLDDPFSLVGSERTDFTEAFTFSSEAFPREIAQGRVRLILGRDLPDHQLVWCSLLEAWVVMDTGHSWVLDDPEQKKPGKDLPLAPARFWQDLSGDDRVMVRVGETAPAKRAEGEKPEMFWKKFEVLAGDGMYTHGAFIHLTPDNIKAFLKKAKKEDAVLWQVDYYFESRYYQIEIPD